MNGSGLWSSGLTARNPARRPMIAEFGVSLNAMGYYPGYSGATPPAIRHYLPEGPLHWVRRRLKNGFAIFHAFGVGGNTSTQGLARISDILSADPKPDYCWLQLGGADLLDITGQADVAAIFTTLTQNIAAITAALRAADIEPILVGFPPHSEWQRIQAQYQSQFRLNQWLANHARKNRMLFVDTYSPFARPQRQLAQACTVLSRTTNVVTATVTGHGYSTGDWVQQTGTVDAGFQLPVNPTYAVVQITVSDANTFTYSHTGADGAATNKGSFVRNDTIADLQQDGVTHWNAKGASKLSLAVKPVLEHLFPAVDELTDSEGDYRNIAGAGIAATSHTVVSRGMMTGTTGTRVGTAVSHTGNVATGVISSVQSGNPTSVTCAKVTRTDAGREHQEWQEVAIVAAAGADCVHDLGLNQTLPSDWAANTVKSLGNFVKPTAPNGFFYVCTGAGTTHAATEPTWPTEPGATVTDGTATWECRLGWKAGDRVWAMGEYLIQAMSDAQAIQCLAFGLIDSGDNNRSILDFDFDAQTNAPLYQVSENGFFCTPVAAIDALTTSLLLGMRTRVTANKSATVRLSRITWRKELA